MLEIGSVLDGKYRILSKIGQGGMSVVYMAINEKANKTWAIKEVSNNGNTDFDVIREGLRIEIEMLKRLNHPHLPSIVDIIDITNDEDKSKDMFLIVMDYIEGISLSKALELYGVQSQEVVIDWAKQLCGVLLYLHTREKPIIYRDMKPQNVMLKPDGDLVLIDFGTAREFKIEKTDASNDTTNLGTVGYAAPEQFGGKGQTDATTDIYCLGATLYHLVTGANPSIPPYVIHPIRSINPKLSSGLEKIIEKCTQRETELRYQSCSELMYDLEHYDEIDEQYIKKQKRKLTGFICSLVFCILFLVAGICFNINTNSMTIDTYDELIEIANKSTDYDEKIEIYQECIGLTGKSGDSEAYIYLMDTFVEGAGDEDSVFTSEEESLLITIVKNNEEELQKNVDEYINVCFEIGRLYWYYYDSSNTTTKMKYSIDWFEDVILYSSEDYENLNMAIAYSEIGKFYRDIQNAIVEGKESGLFSPFYKNLVELIEEVANNSEEKKEIVRLELLSLARSAVEQYASKFKADGISQEALILVLDNVEEIANSIAPTSDITIAKKTEILSNIDEAEYAINTAYGTTGGMIK